MHEIFTTQIIKEKRRQDYVRALGLLPLNRRSPEADVLKRYQLIQQFKKESKQFGNQRQVSEGLAVKISLENLARTAGYTDPIRLTWAMETKEAQEIIANATVVEKEGTSIHLTINEFGKASITAQKGDKLLFFFVPNFPFNFSTVEKEIRQKKAFFNP